MRPETAKLLWDAREACRLVLEFSTGRTLDDYEESALLRSAVERQLEIVGEALRRLSRMDPETAARIPELESVVGFRNVLAHGYDAVSDRVAWDVVRNDVPAAVLIPHVLAMFIAMLFSTVSSSSALASVFTVGVVVAGRFTDVVRNMREVAPGVPPWLVDALYAVVPNFRNFDFKDKVAYGDPVSADVLAWVTAYGLAYVGAVLVLGLVREISEKTPVSQIK